MAQVDSSDPLRYGPGACCCDEVVVSRYTTKFTLRPKPAGPGLGHCVSPHQVLLVQHHAGVRRLLHHMAC